MNQVNFSGGIYEQHKLCCVVSQCTDEGCDLNVHGWTIPPLAVLDGTTYQRIHMLAGPLCDFVVLGHSTRSFICAVEMKGGANLDAKHAIDQIQAGLRLTETMVSQEDVDHWVPVLLRHPGAGNFWDLRILNSHRAKVKFHKEEKTVERRDCGCSLDDILGFGP